MGGMVTYFGRRQPADTRACVDSVPVETLTLLVLKMHPGTLLTRCTGQLPGSEGGAARIRNRHREPTNANCNDYLGTSGVVLSDPRGWTRPKVWCSGKQVTT